MEMIKIEALGGGNTQNDILLYEMLTGVSMQSTEQNEKKQHISENFGTLIENGTWKLSDKILWGVRLLPSSSVLRHKRDAQGCPARFETSFLPNDNFHIVSEQLC